MRTPAATRILKKPSSYYYYSPPSPARVCVSFFVPPRAARILNNTRLPFDYNQLCAGEINKFLNSVDPGGRNESQNSPPEPNKHRDGSSRTSSSSSSSLRARTRAAINHRRRRRRRCRRRLATVKQTIRPTTTGRRRKRVFSVFARTKRGETDACRSVW